MSIPLAAVARNAGFIFLKDVARTAPARAAIQ